MNSRSQYSSFVFCRLAFRRQTLRTLLFTFLLTCFCHQVIAQQREPSAIEDLDAATAETMLGTYCAQCHGNGESEGDFELKDLMFESGNDSARQHWEAVGRAISDRDMPPEDAEQPTDVEREQILAWVKKAAAVPGKPPVVRRMNRVEYENTIRDLFEISRDAFANPDKILRIDEYFKPSSKKLPRYVFAVSHYAFPDRQRPELLEVSTPPPDLPAEHGFTNDVSSLQFSPLLAEKYIQLSREIVDSPTLRTVSGLWPMFVEPAGNATPEKLESAAASQLRKFLSRAFRRPASDEEVAEYLALFEREFDASGQYAAAMKSTIASILISPKFLFLYQNPEQDSWTESQRQSYFNASRLSYFLWASMPDEPLLEAAKRGEVYSAQQVRQQARRMMLDRRVKSLATDFGMQWLKVNRLPSSQPDPEKYVKFYGRKKQPIGIAMMIEQLLLFEAILVEDRSILDFVHADFAYMNRDLLMWYGYRPGEYLGFEPPHASPEDFFRIQFPQNHSRGGAITSGATLVLTSTSLRTSPVFRGVWIAETIFNKPPPPPPVNVPALEKIESGDSAKPLNVREKLAIHRDNPACNSCHAKIDPLGFGLEQFDPVGKIRRTYDNGERVESAGEIDGHKYQHAVGMKKLILAKKHLFVRAFVKHLLRYAVNRELTLADDEDIDHITESVLQGDCRFHSVVDHIISSKTFQADGSSSKK